MPPYFSSTNSRASGAVYVLPPPFGGTMAPQFDSANLYIGGNLVKHWERGGGDIPIQQLRFDLMFDSSFFAPYTPVEVKITAIDNYLRPYYEAKSSPAKNFGHLHNRGEFTLTLGGNGATSVAAQLSPVNYDCALHLFSWTKSSYCANLKGPLAYVAAHGTLEWHSDSSTPGESIFAISSGDPLETDRYDGAREVQNGTGLPPFNSTGEPPLSVLLGEWCNGGDFDVFLTALSI